MHILQITVTCTRSTEARPLLAVQLDGLRSQDLQREQEVLQRVHHRGGAR